MTNRYAQELAQQLHLRPQQVSNTIKLLDDGSTVPFIARYRKEITGGLDEENIRQLLAGVTTLRNLDERRETVIASVEEQGQLTSDLRQKFLAAETMTELEDLYQPYKPKRRSSCRYCP